MKEMEELIYTIENTDFIENCHCLLTRLGLDDKRYLKLLKYCVETTHILHYPCFSDWPADCEKLKIAYINAVNKIQNKNI